MTPPTQFTIGAVVLDRPNNAGSTEVEAVFTLARAAVQVRAIFDATENLLRWVLGMALGIAALFLGERVRLRRSIATAVGFAGVLIMVKPQAGIEPAALVALLAAILATGAITTMKSLTRSEPTERIVFYFLIYGTVLLGLPAIYFFQRAGCR